MNEIHEKLLEAYFTGHITDEQREEVVKLLETDSEFAKGFQELEKAYINAYVPVFEKGKAANFKIIRDRIEPRHRIMSYWRACAVAASVAAVVLLGISLYVGEKFHQAESFLCQSDEMTITAKRGTGTETTLPDGTRVCLNASSSLTFDRHFGRNTRDVKLIGEGYFEVASDAGRPFRVHTDKACVTVKGTVFNVRNYADERNMTVSLLEGSVMLSTPCSEVTLKPGLSAVVSRENGHIRVENADPYAADWIKGKLVFTDKSIPEILASLERNYGVCFVYADGLFTGERFTGNISYNLSIDEILSYIDVDKKYRWKRTEGTIEIYKK